MKGGSNIVSGVHCLKQAFDHFTSFQLEHKDSKGAIQVQAYKTRIEWIVRQITTNPYLSQPVRDAVRKEWESDAWAVPAIAEKAALLSPEQREAFETLLDALLNGEELTFEKVKEEN